MSLDQHNALVFLLVMLALLIGVGSLNKHLRTREQTRRTWGAHHRAHRHLHRAGLTSLVAGLVLAVTGIGIAAAVYTGGAFFDPSRHIAPHRISAGGAPRVPVNLGQYVLHDLNQGASNACWAFSTVNALRAAELQRGATLAPLLSPFALYFAGGSTVGNDDEAMSLINSGHAEPFGDWPTQGGPDAHDAAAVIPYHGGHVAHLFYGRGYGQSAADVIYDALDKGHVVVILWQTHTDAEASGQWVMRNTGPVAFNHYTVIYGWDYLPGTRTPGWLMTNQWLGWGVGGNAIWSVSESEPSLYAADVIEAGAPVPAWMPPPRAAPTSTSTSTVRPLPRPVPPTPLPPPRATARPGSLYYGVYVTVHLANLRAAPVAGARVIRGLALGSRLRSLGAEAGGWRRVTAHGSPGWVQAAVLRRSSVLPRSP